MNTTTNASGESSSSLGVPVETSETVAALFRDIDKEFIKLNKVTDEVYTYHASDVLIQSHWELPIILQWPKSTITFDFSSENVMYLL